MWRKNLILILIFTITGCDKFSKHPYQLTFTSAQQQLSKKNIELMKQMGKEEGDTLNIAIVSDTQLSLDEFKDGVEHINSQQELDMVIHCGDFTNTGSNREFIWMYEILKDLRVPYFVVFGNHDALGTGKEAYNEMFGAFDFSFAIAGHKFIFLNTNSWEFTGDKNRTVPNLKWLQSQLEDSTIFKDAFIISHMAPQHHEFEEPQAAQFHHIIKNDYVKLVIHGHGHRYRTGQLYKTGVQYLSIDNIKDRNYVLLKVFPKGYGFTPVFY